MSKTMTYCPNIAATNNCSPLSLSELVQIIETGEDANSQNKEIVKITKLKIEASLDSDEKDRLKKSLPIFVAAGLFASRSHSGLQKYSRFIIIDIDYKVPTTATGKDEDWNYFRKFAFVTLMFHSPNNGIKLLIQHNNDDENLHKELFGQICATLNCEKIDRHGSDVARACFFSYDPNLYFNPQSTIFNFSPTNRVIKITPQFKGQKKQLQIAQKTKTVALSGKEEEEVLRKIQAWSDSDFPICHGSRNVNTYKFAYLLCQEGVSKSSALEYLMLKYIGTDEKSGYDFGGEEIENIVESAYL